VHYLDQAQLEFWREREKSERQRAAQCTGDDRDRALKLADGYAVLIAQMIGKGPANANE